MRIAMKTGWFACTLIAGACLASGAGHAADLTIGLDTAPTSMDPYFHAAGQNVGPLSNIFDTLIANTPDLKLAPGLATAWKAVDDTTWRLDLRKGVKFQDGSEFTADDVIFSLKRVPKVPNSPSSAEIYIKSIVSMTAPDPYTIIFKCPSTNMLNLLNRL